MVLALVVVDPVPATALITRTVIVMGEYQVVSNYTATGINW
jgi:hypothetical protein